MPDGVVLLSSSTVKTSARTPTAGPFHTESMTSSPIVAPVRNCPSPARHKLSASGGCVQLIDYHAMDVQAGEAVAFGRECLEAAVRPELADC